MTRYRSILLLALALSSSALADSRPVPTPKALWHVRGEQKGGAMKYTLHTHRSAGAPLTLPDLEHALETQVSAGEWVIEDGGVDDAATAALRALAAKRKF